VQSRFPAPLYFPCRVLVRGEIVSWFAAAQSGVLRVRIEDQASSQLTAEVQMSFGLHEERSPAPVSTLNAAAPGERPLLLVTGANGALGRELVAQYSERFEVLGCMRSAAASTTPSTGAAGERAGRSIELDLESDHWEELASRAVGERPVYGIVHAAWPGAPKGGLLGLELEAVRRQLDFGALVTIRLARWLASHSTTGARLVLLGSTAASLHPELALSGYALGKSVLEHVVRLLAPELAPRAITINAVLPSYMPIGMNRSKSERATLLEAARVPAGRVCTIGDVVAAVDYLLAPAASFFTGQLLALSGGRL
jgi:3-oxoacyl-[acyl-carrier protein] reductase